MKTFSKLMLPCAILLCLATGCSTGDFSGKTIVAKMKLPIIPMPERPKLVKLNAAQLTAYEALPQDVRDALENNNDAVQGYAKQLEIGLTKFNNFAEMNNAAALEFTTGDTKGK